MLHETNLTQHVNFPTHDPGSQTLDLVITSTDSSLNPAVTHAITQPSDHFPVFSYLNLSPNLPPPPPQSYTFRQLNSIDYTSFLDDLKQSSLITNPPQLLNPLLDEYDTTLHSLLDKHACVITKRSTRHSPSLPWFTESIRTAHRTCRQAESTYRSTHSSSDHSIFMSLRNQYHKLVLAAKRAYYSFMVKFSSDCLRRQWSSWHST